MADEKPQETTTDNTQTTVVEPAIPTAPELQTPPAEAPPLQEFHETEERRWPTIIMYLVGALIVAFVVVLLARFVYHVFHKSKPPKQPPTGQTPGGSTSTHTKPTKTKPQQPIASTGANMPNTGPGSVATIFIGTTLVAGGLHFIWSLRRAAKPVESL